MLGEATHLILPVSGLRSGLRETGHSELRGLAGTEASRGRTLTVQCNGCHAANDLAYFHVVPPEVRTSVIRRPPG